MRRERSGACHAEFYEEYIQKIKVIDAIGTKSNGPTVQVSPYNACTLEKANPLPVFNTQKSFEKNRLYEEFSFNRSDKESSEQQAKDQMELEEQAVVESVQSRVKTLIVGSKEIPTHNFVHFLVPGELEEKSMKGSLDLVVKTCKEVNKTTKYHFWIKGCDEEEERDKFKGIYNVYYNFVSSLVLLYSVHCRESFALLKKSIEEIRKTVGVEGSKAILVGLVNGEDLNIRKEINTFEGEKLKNEEGFAEFIEMEMNDVSIRSKILSFLCNKAENQVKKSP